MNLLPGLLFVISPLLLSALIGTILAFTLVRYWRTPGAAELIVLILAGSLWSAGYSAEIASQQFAVKLLWAKFQYFGIVTVPPAWFLFAIRYLDTSAWLHQRRRYWPLLGVIPAITLFLVWTNESHRLIWQQEETIVRGALTLLDVSHGVWFWVNAAYSYIIMLLGSFWLISHLLSFTRLTYWQVSLAVAGAIIPWIGNFLYVTHLTAIPEIDWTPFGFTIAGILFSLSLFRYQLVRVVPVAMRAVFDELADGVLVLDRRGILIDGNLAARRLIEKFGQEQTDRPLAHRLPPLAGMLAAPAFDQELEAEISLEARGSRRIYEAHLLPLQDQLASVIGQVLILHDVTERQQAQAELQKAYAVLEERVADRTQALQLANQQLSFELEQRRVAEQRFEDIVSSAPDAILVIDAGRKITLANAQAGLIFGRPVAAFTGMNVCELLPERLRAEYLASVDEFLAGPGRRQTEQPYQIYGLRGDGTEFPAEVQLSLLQATAGVAIACIVRDITVRKEAERQQAALLQEVQESHQQLRLLSARLEEVQENERRQIAAELHDRVGQNLTALNLNLQSIQNKLAPLGNSVIQNRLVDSLDLVEQTTRQVRNVMADLNPPLLEEYGLLPALHWYGEKFTARTGIRVVINGSAFLERLLPRQESTLFRIVQEALNNVAKHSRATQVDIIWTETGGVFRLCLEDDGQGFEPETVTTGEQPHWGLLSMKERAAAVNGQIAIHSAPDRGTQIEIEIRRNDGDQGIDRG